MTILRAKKTTSNKTERLKKSLINPKNVTPFNLLIDADLHKRFKIKTISEGTSMTDVITEAIENYLE